MFQEIILWNGFDAMEIYIRVLDEIQVRGQTAVGDWTSMEHEWRHSNLIPVFSWERAFNGAFEAARLVRGN